MPSDLAELMGDGDGPAITGKQPNLVMARQVTRGVRVGREGELVTLTIGTTTCRFTWKDAMMIGQWLMAKGCEAKFLDGETKRLFIDAGRTVT